MSELTPRDRLESVLAAQDLSANKLAQLTGISPSQISAYLRGERHRMSLENWIAVAKVLDVSLDWVAGLPPRDKESLAPDEAELLRLWRKVKLDLIKDTTLSTLRAAVALEERDKGILPPGANQ